MNIKHLNIILLSTTFILTGCSSFTDYFKNLTSEERKDLVVYKREASKPPIDIFKWKPIQKELNKILSKLPNSNTNISNNNRNKVVKQFNKIRDYISKG